MEEIQSGESLIAIGQYENGVEHLANALVVCGQPGRLLQILQASLPTQVFTMLIIRMQEVSTRVTLDSTERLKINSIENNVEYTEVKKVNPDMIDDLE